MSRNSGFSVVAVLLGAASDIGCSIVFGLAFGVVLGIVLAAQGVPLSQVQALAESVTASLSVVFTVVGLAFTVLGGFVAGRVSKRREVLHGGLVGVLGLLFGLLSLFGSNPMPLWLQVFGYVATIPSGMAGGALAKRFRQMRIPKVVIERRDDLNGVRQPAGLESSSNNPYSSPNS